MFEFFSLHKQKTKDGLHPEALETELQALADGMAMSIQRLQRIEQELAARRNTAEALKAEAVRNQQLASINREAADAVNELLAGHIKDSSKRSSRLTVISSISSLILGAALSWMVGAWTGQG